MTTVEAPTKIHSITTILIDDLVMVVIKIEETVAETAADGSSGSINPFRAVTFEAETCVFPVPSGLEWLLCVLTK